MARRKKGQVGLVDRVTQVLDRGGTHGPRGGGGLTGNAASFVAGFLSGDDVPKRGRRRRRR